MPARVSALVLYLSLVLSPLALGQPANPNDWVGKRVITKFGAVLAVDGKVVDNEKRVSTVKGSQKRDFRIYRVEQTNGRWIWIQDEESGAAGWITAEWLILYEQAIDYFTNEIRANPKNDSAYNSRGNLWREKKEYDIAIADFNEAIRLDPADGACWNNRGLALIEKKEYDMAIADFNEAIRLDPDTWAYLNRGLAWSDKKEYDKAIADCNEAIRLDPKFPMAYNNRGCAWSDKKEYDKAIADYNEAIRFDPKFARAYSNRCFAWHAKKEYDKAIADCNEILRLNPKDAGAYHNRSFVWSEKGEYDKAIADANEAIRLDPNDAYALSNRGYALSGKMLYDKAIADYNEAIRLGPNEASTYYYRVMAYFLSREDGQAISGMKDVLEKGGWSGEYAAYAVILGHFAATRSEKLDEAKQFLDDFKAKGDMTAWPAPVVRYLKGEIDEKALLAASTDNDQLTESHAYLGIDLLLKKKTDEAKAHFLWVKEHGQSRQIPYSLSLAELDRLEKAKDARTKP